MDQVKAWTRKGVLGNDTKRSCDRQLVLVVCRPKDKLLDDLKFAAKKTVSPAIPPSPEHIGKRFTISSAARPPGLGIRRGAFSRCSRWLHRQWRQHDQDKQERDSSLAMFFGDNRMERFIGEAKEAQDTTNKVSGFNFTVIAADWGYGRRSRDGLWPAPALAALPMGLDPAVVFPKLLDEAEDVLIYFSGHTHGRR